MILTALPEELRAHFRTEYTAAVDSARRPEEYRQLQDLLHLWRLRATAYASPGYGQRLESSRRADAAEFVPAGELIPGWPGK